MAAVLTESLAHQSHLRVPFRRARNLENVALRPEAAVKQKTAGLSLKKKHHEKK